MCEPKVTVSSTKPVANWLKLTWLPGVTAVSVPVGPTSDLAAFGLLLQDLKMGRAAMRLERGGITILFVDEEAAGIVSVPVDDVHQASWLLTRSCFQLGEDDRNLILVSRMGQPMHRQDKHCILRFKNRWVEHVFRRAFAGSPQSRFSA